VRNARLVTPAIGASTTGADGLKSPIFNGNMTRKRYRHGVSAPTTPISRSFSELTAREFHDIVKLRCDVFVVEQECAYAELDGRDVEAGTEHHWIVDDGSVVGYARTLAEPDGSIRIGRVVTAPVARGRGLAGELMRALLDRFGGGDLVLDAQSHLAGWYGRFGFVATGGEFVEDGIAHVPMRRRGVSG
jgi:ElaA protein